MAEGIPLRTGKSCSERQVTWILSVVLALLHPSYTNWHDDPMFGDGTGSANSSVADSYASQPKER